jgi:single-strand DNA-binding protein
MRDMNRVTLVGRLGRNAEVKYLPSGQAMAELSIATSDYFKGKDGQSQEKTDWHNVVIWGKSAEHARSLTKGARVMIEGKLQTRSWDGKDGKKQYKTEVVAFSYEELGGQSKPREVAQPQASQPEAEPSYDDDEIPF